jgi:hypothetical protein
MPAHQPDVSDLITFPTTARAQADEQARVAAEVVALLCSGHQLLNESGLPRIFTKVQWTVVGSAGGRDPSWVVVEDAADPTYLLVVRRARLARLLETGYEQYRHIIKVAVPARVPWRRWRAIGQNITRPEHLAAYLARGEVRS